ncbi:MAG TPA: SPOR domain-containing protein [Croceibacterium sp.]|nr:SPOR domain-containing protein [Croceibacterium sp.]
MRFSLNKRAVGAVGLVALLGAGLTAMPLHADVQSGVDAWSRGDYAAAVREWEGPAAGGDADALFNLAQAYRFGRGVPVDSARAESLYARAAAAGHSRAADTYGLLLFEEGRREAAMPYLRDAAGRGDARAQYLLGIAHFNGDFVQEDWPRAYALMTLANAAGLPQAAPALAEMDRVIPETQRRQAGEMAQQMRSNVEAGGNAGLAAANTAPQAASLSPVAPSLPSTSEPSEPAPAAVVADGRWRVQLGAFSVAENADALWRRLSDRSELAGTTRITPKSGRLTFLQAGGFPTREAAAAACAALKQSGHDCIVTDR